MVNAELINKTSEHMFWVQELSSIMKAHNSAMKYTCYSVFRVTFATPHPTGRDMAFESGPHIGNGEIKQQQESNPESCPA